MLGGPFRACPAPAGVAIALGVLLGSAASLNAQAVECAPVAQRGDRSLGCFITARAELGALPRDTALYWYIDALPNRPAAPTSVEGRSLVVESLDRLWRFTIAAAGLPGEAGRRLAVIGPLPLIAADSFAAVYMEGIFRPGMQTQAHRHAGVEAWYTLEGEQCVETPNGMQRQGAGDPGILVPGGVPMRLTGAGNGIRRSLVLILQDATQPRSMLATDWVPQDLCSR